MPMRRKFICNVTKQWYKVHFTVHKHVKTLPAPSVLMFEEKFGFIYFELPSAAVWPINPHLKSFGALPKKKWMLEKPGRLGESAISSIHSGVIGSNPIWSRKNIFIFLPFESNYIDSLLESYTLTAYLFGCSNLGDESLATVNFPKPWSSPMLLNSKNDGIIFVQ